MNTLAEAIKFLQDMRIDAMTDNAIHNTNELHDKTRLLAIEEKAVVNKIINTTIINLVNEFLNIINNGEIK